MLLTWIGVVSAAALLASPGGAVGRGAASCRLPTENHMTKTKKPTSPASTTAGKPKRDQLVELLGGTGGVSIHEMANALGWQPHTIRAMLTGLRKSGLTIVKVKVDGTSRYSIADSIR